MKANTNTNAATSSTTTRKPTGWIVATSVTASLALAGMAAAAIVSLAPAHQSAGTSASTGHTTSQTTPSSNSTPSNNTNGTRPSASLEVVQEELGQLNYYEGPINGYDTRATVEAITYLQRDAHLPQTGTLNAATERALTTMLATGNNNMDS